MPSPSTSFLPIPKSWDEFEDICADLLKELWRDSFVTRNGRSGQAQNGVDIYGQPAHLGGSASGCYAGVQCKLTKSLSFATIETEVKRAESFKPTLTEFMIMTTASRDSKLQEDIRIRTWVFPVKIRFWEDISLELSGLPHLLQKFYPNWVQAITTSDKVRDLILSIEDPNDFDYNPMSGEILYKKDIRLVIRLDLGPESDQPFDEPWLKNFIDPRATKLPVCVSYGSSNIFNLLFITVDGGRHLIPIPESMNNLTISFFDAHLGFLVNQVSQLSDYYRALKKAGISVCPPSQQV